MTQDSLQRHPAASRNGAASPSARMTGRGSVLAMFAVFFTGTLTAELLHLGFLTGLAVLAGCVLAARFARRSALLAVAISPPLIFAIAVVCAEAITASASGAHSGFLATAEGIFLTLAGTAPWLFASVAAGLVIALLRGLPQCVRDLREELRGR